MFRESAWAPLLFAVAGAAFLVYALDGHSHRCDSCGYSWYHLGAFNVGDAKGHTCANCGSVQWWKDIPHGPNAERPPGATVPPITSSYAFNPSRALAAKAPF